MLTRRHIRVNVLQSIYYFNHNNHQDLDIQEKFLWYSLVQLRDLYLLQLQFFIDIRKHAEKYRKRSKNRFTPSHDTFTNRTNFINNKLLLLLENSEELNETIENKRLNYWELDDEFVHSFFN